MGKKGKWFSAVKNAFRSSKSKENVPVKAPSKEENEINVTDPKSKRSKDKRRWSFGKSVQLDNAGEVARPGEQAVLSEKSLSQVEDEQNKHALAVAAATAAAAEAAVAAAQAAAEVIRLTGASAVPRPSSYSAKSKEDLAAIKIQTAFRGYLARRALRALRGLVRLQALIRGHTVRRQATLTLRCMQALVRVQARVRARRVRMSEEGQAVQRQLWQRRQQEILSRKSSSEGQEHQDWDDSLQSLEEIEAKKLSKQEAAMKRERALAYAFSHQLWRSSPRQPSSMYIDCEPDKPHWGWSWLERWMAARPWEGRMFVQERTASSDASADDVKVKTVNVDMAVNKAGSLVNNNGNNVNLTTPKSARLKGTGPQQQKPVEYSPSTPTFKKPPAVMVRSASPRGHNQIQKAGVPEDEGNGASTARSGVSINSLLGPRFINVRNSVAGSSVRDDESLVSSPAVPNYMTATQSARAKARSLSNPKQRPVTPDKEQHGSAKKRLSFPFTHEQAMHLMQPSATSTPKHPKPMGLTQRSPSVKGLPGSSLLQNGAPASPLKDSNGDVATAALHADSES